MKSQGAHRLKFDIGQRVTLTCEGFEGFKAIVTRLHPGDDVHPYECAYCLDGAEPRNWREMPGAYSDDFFRESDMVPGWAEGSGVQP